MKVTIDTLRIRKHCIHQLGNDLTAVEGFLEVGNPDKARVALKKAFVTLSSLRHLLQVDEENHKKNKVS